MAMAHNTSTKLHVMLVSYPFQGHITPTVNLALRLAAKGLIVTFVNAEAKQQSLTKMFNSSGHSKHSDIFSEARSAGLDIRYEIVSDYVPQSIDILKYPYEVLTLLSETMPAHVEKLLQRNVSEGRDRVTCLITDMLFVWSATVAEKFRIPLVWFWTEAATVFSIYCHYDLLIKKGYFDCEEKDRVTITYIPGIPSIEPTDLVSYLQVPKISPQDYQYIFKAFNDIKFAKFILSNSVQELEPECIKALQHEQNFLAIGPVLQSEFISSIINTSLWPQSDCSEWLNMQPQASVVYISFGSIFQPNEKDLLEMLCGVLSSKANFLLVQPHNVEWSDGFNNFLKENIEGRGMSVEWCNQKEVLKNPGIGGFLTHCGWNSILESMHCGVPMLCFPLCSDQFTNRKLVVKDWKIGLDIGRTDNIKRDEVCKIINNLIGEDYVGIELRKKIKEVKQMVESALSSTGSSTKNFDHFIEKLLKLVT